MSQQDSVKKRILICSNVYPPAVIGGAELIAHYQAQVLKERGHQVVIYCGDPGSGRQRYSIRQDTYEGLTVIRACLEPSDFPPEYVNFFHARIEDHFEQLLDKFRPHVVHMHNLTGLSVGLISKAKRRGIKTILTVHDHWGFCYKNTLIKTDSEICQNYTRCAECMPYIQDGNNRSIPIRLRRDFLAMQLAELDVLISPSLYLASTYVRAGIPGSKTRVVWYGVDVDRFSRVSKTPRTGPVRFTFVGYLGRHKGVDLILDAARLLRGSSFLIHLVGAGELMDYLRQRVEREGLASLVRFWGKVEHSRIEKVFQETDVQILPSIWPENQPVSITESMATRTPVVAARIGGIPELVSDGVTGYLFEPGSAADLAAKMAGLIQHPEKIAELGEAGFRKIQTYSLENQVDKILAVYDEVDLPEPAGMSGGEALVACAGERFAPEAAIAIEALGRLREYDTCRFVMSEWLTEDQLGRAKLLWVVDRSSPPAVAHLALQHRLPLLVSHENTELTDVCRSENCGLYYRNAEEACECLAYLLGNHTVASALGNNGFAYRTRCNQARSFMV